MSNSVILEKSETAKLSTLAKHDQLVSHILGDPSGLHFKFLAEGRIHSICQGKDFLLNLILGCPLSGGLQRLYVELDLAGSKTVVPVMGPGAAVSFAVNDQQALWRTEVDKVTIESRLSLNPSGKGWTLEVSVENNGDSALSWRAFHGLDVGLAHVNAVRTNESYTSQYLDHRALDHSSYGKVIATRQNLAVDGKHPVLLQACLEGCAEFASEGRDVFGGAIHRDSLLPLRLREGAEALPGIRQSEMSYVAILSPWFELQEMSLGVCHFVGVLGENHVEPTSSATLSLLDGECQPPQKSYS